MIIICDLMVIDFCLGEIVCGGHFHLRFGYGNLLVCQADWPANLLVSKAIMTTILMCILLLFV